MHLPTAPQWLTLAVSTFLGAFVASLTQTGDDPLVMFTSWPAAKPAIAGAVVAGVIAVTHLYQRAPQDKAVVEAAK